MKKSLLFAIFLIIFPELSLAGNGCGSISQGEYSYFDHKHQFSFQYPTDWMIIPRSDHDPQIIDTLEIVHSENGQHIISIGYQAQRIEETTDVLSWTQKRLRAQEILLGPSDFRIEPYEIPDSGMLKNQKPEDITYISTEVGQYVNLRRGNVIWFISANFTEKNTYLTSVFLSIVDSFLFSNILQEEVMPLESHEEIDLLDSLSNSSLKHESALKTSNLNSTWFSPVHNQSNGNPWPINCGSSFHINGSSHAADIAVPINTAVRVAKAGTVTLSQNNPNVSTFGKYVVVNTSGKYHYYAHLNSIRSYVQTNYTFSRAKMLIGYSGNSGGNFGYHLHFHVQNGSSHTGSSGVNLNGMVGFSSNSNYPSSWGACGSMGR